MDYNEEWKFVASNVEVSVSGRSVRQKPNVSESGLYYRVFEDDLNIHIVGLFRRFIYSIKKDIVSVSWKFFKDGKFTISSKNRSVIFFSNAVPSSIFNLIENIYLITPQCLIPPFLPIDNSFGNSSIEMGNLKNHLYRDSETEVLGKRKPRAEVMHDGIYKPKNHNKTREKSNIYINVANIHDPVRSLHNLPDDLLFYILSMLIYPENERCEASSSCQNFFFKDKLLKSTNIAFANRKLLKFFQNNIWEISINKKMNNRPYRLNKNYNKLGSILINNKYLRDPEIRWFFSSKQLSTSINKCSIIGNNHISESTLKLFLSKFRNLECIEIIDCKKISGESVLKLLKVLPSIKFLKIGNLSTQRCSINDISFENTLNPHENKSEGSEISKELDNSKLVHLELLNYSKMTKISFIRNFCCTLEYLDLRGCGNISGSEFECLFRHMKKLKVLILANSSITDQKLDILLDNCPQLEILDISNSNASECTLEKIPSKLKNILGLKLSYCNNLKIESLIKVLNDCKHLEVLDLTGCCQIEDKIVNSLVETNIPNNLKRIGIHRLPLNSRKFKNWILEKMGPNSIQTNFEVFDKELPISEFVRKYEAIKKNYLERNKPIWAC
ncbi:leucine-rich repeat protein [Cryptosporidium felis]|nr:leucine-rich repeat protein [Cryptosporidium felis]